MMDDDLDELNECFSVIFHNVKESYSRQFPIECQFTVKENTITHPPDSYWIGIFLVAWDSLESAVLKTNFACVELTTNKSTYSLDFDVTNSSFDEEEFYQFCFYDTQTADILGASCPFQVYSTAGGAGENLIGMESMIHIGYDGETTSNSTSSSTTSLRGGLISEAAEDERDNNNVRLEEEDVSLTCSSSSSSRERGWWLKDNDKPLEEDLEDSTVLIHNKTTRIEDALAKVSKEKDEELLASKLKFENDLKQCTNEKEETIRNVEAQVDELRQKNQVLVTSEKVLKEDLKMSQSEMKALEKRATENAKKATVLLQSLTAEKDKLAVLLSAKEVEHARKISQLTAEFDVKVETTEEQCSELGRALISERDRVMKMELQYEEEVSVLRNEIEQMNVRENESATELALVVKELHTKLNAEIAQKQNCMVEIEKLSRLVETLSEEVRSKEALIQSERDKVEAFSLEQEEMTSRLALESDRLRDEIERLKSAEASSSLEHEDDMFCLRNQLSEMEASCTEERMKHKKEVEGLSNELNDKVNCMNLLQAKMRECEETFIETHNQEKLELSDIIDELKTRLTDVEHETTQSADEAKKQLCKNCENGSKHALHVAIAHMQKQLNIYKKEKEKLVCSAGGTGVSCDLQKQNEEFKLRLCMGKRAFDKQYLECQRMRSELNKLKKKTKESDQCCSETNATQEDYDSLLAQFNDLRVDSCKKIDDLSISIESNEEGKRRQEKQMKKLVDDKDTAYKLNEELKSKMLEIVDNYEGKLTLLTEENSMLRTQLDVLLEGSSLHSSKCNPDIVPTTTNDKLPHPKPFLIDRKVTESAASHTTPGVVNEQPHNSSAQARSGNETIVERQPTLLSLAENRYSHEMLYHSKGGPQAEIVTPKLGHSPLIRAEPPSQMISDRSSLEDGSPAKKCPICDLDFPSNLNDEWKNQHVNSHFEQQ